MFSLRRQPDVEHSDRAAAADRSELFVTCPRHGEFGAGVFLAPGAYLALRNFHVRCPVCSYDVVIRDAEYSADELGHIGSAGEPLQVLGRLQQP